MNTNHTFAYDAVSRALGGDAQSYTVETWIRTACELATARDSAERDALLRFAESMQEGR